MTYPKLKSCASCHTPNQANRKICFVCCESLSTKKNLNEKVQLLDREWEQAVVKNRNVGRIIDSARIAVRELEAIGYKPILFFGKKRESFKQVGSRCHHPFETHCYDKKFPGEDAESL
ncbi:hypothetical protein ILYODFUR_032361 [Ilyodon furcidens]|uniref:Uncharacterized protein n=1 Tax=Ilyodon furcidens TaxID=33524 RepID=A0ABV0UBI5_9TELE